MRQSIFLLAAAAALLVGCSAGPCSFNHNTLVASIPNQALLLQPNGPLDARGFLPVSSTGVVTLQAGEQVHLACPGDMNYLTGGNALSWQEVVAECIDGTSFLANGYTLDITKVACYTAPIHVVVDSWNACGTGLTGLDATTLSVGFRLQRGFLTLYTACFDKALLHTSSVETYVRPGLRSTRTLTANSTYLFLDVNPDLQYQRTQEITTFTALLNDDLAKKYITTANYIVNIHLAPKDDFVFWPEQRAAYYYINSAPVWLQVSTGIWANVLTSIRTMATRHGDLLVNTSVHGQATINNEKGVPTKLYMYVEGTDRRIPMPEYIVKDVSNQDGFRVLFIETANEGTVAASAAAPRSVAPPCADVCAQLDLLPWRHVPAHSRTVHCCRADDPLLLSRVPELRDRLSGPARLLV